VSESDRLRWDSSYASRESASAEAVAVPAVFADQVDEFPTTGHSLEIACGQGGTSVWLARRGLRVWGTDISSVAIGQARNLAERCQVHDRCRFSVIDLDDGLPPGESMNVIVCHRFRAPHLYSAMVERLAPGGLLAISVLSQVGAGPGTYRAPPGELIAAFAGLDLIDEGEGDGIAWLMARR
jgi:2-polyprenyl-3-methyl-5-hydroxy-6-metoxy-1,4-benzoquinol methylase